MTKKLTEFSKSSGCGCKVQPAVLQQMLQGMTLQAGATPGLVHGNAGGDDCSVFDLGDGQLLLQTVDFFTPLLDDPYDFGRAAAANALSDIWAMGGRPMMANAVMGWPIEVLGVEVARRVMEGAMQVCSGAGVALAGGHTIELQEPVFGLSVTGLVRVDQLKTNAGAQLGDVLILTKSLGVGMLSAALKRGLGGDKDLMALTSSLTQTNAVGSVLGGIAGVHAMTDVTGFGLGGHLLEVCRASGVGARIEGALLPRIEEAESWAGGYVLPDNAMRNWNAFEGEIVMGDAGAFAWLVDPQTSGGLLISVSSSAVGDVEAALHAASTSYSIIGEMVDLTSLPPGKLLSVI
ncbi:MAG: selenide, water dikinase SelD [Bacteroidota bacterium]